MEVTGSSFKGIGKGESLHIFGVSIGDTSLVDVEHRGDDKPYAVGQGDDLVGIDAEEKFLGWIQIGTDEWEVCLVGEEGESVELGVEFVVAYGGEIELQRIHQLNHGKSFLRVLVVDGVARLVVAARKEQHMRIDGAKAVDHEGETWEVIDGGVHVVHREDLDGTVGLADFPSRCRLAFDTATGSQDERKQEEGEKPVPGYFF